VSADVEMSAATARGGAAEAPSLAGAPVGTVPILWNNVDVPDLAPRVRADVVLDEIARLEFAGTQTGVGFPEGDALVTELERRGLRLAEIYAALPCSADGPSADAAAVARDRLAALHAAGGDVLVVALDLTPEREAVAGRTTGPTTAPGGVPCLSDTGWTRLGELLDTIARDATGLGHRLGFHPHAGTFVETPHEVDRLVAITNPPLGICLDVGHFIVGGGDPVEAVERHGSRIVHVHLKDVAAKPLAELRAGRLGGFRDALRSRLFAELGSGVLDLDGVLNALARQEFAGWLMVEQDTTWRPPSESAAISRSVLDYAIRHIGRAAA
jgi:inosose dehydratase